MSTALYFILDSDKNSGFGGDMNTLFTFILGLLVGWLIEWLIDYFYWRRRYAEKEVVSARQTTSESRVASVSTLESRPVVKAAPDDL